MLMLAHDTPLTVHFRGVEALLLGLRSGPKSFSECVAGLRATPPPVVGHALEVLEADGPEAALRLAQERSPDAAILDIAMPDLNGIDAANLIRDQHPATRVLMLSMYSTVEHVHRAFAAGVNR